MREHTTPGIAAKATFAALIAGALTCLPIGALAETPSLEDLQNKAIEAGQNYQIAQDKVDDINRQIEENQSHIDEIETKLPEQREKAAVAMRSQYRFQESSPNLIGLILDSNSVNEFIEQVTYLDTIANSQADEIAQLNSMEDDLTSTKATLEGQKKQAEQDAKEAKRTYDDARSTSEAAQQKAREDAAAAQAAYEAQVAAGNTSDATTEAVAQSEAKNPSPAPVSSPTNNSNNADNADSGESPSPSKPSPSKPSDSSSSKPSPSDDSSRGSSNNSNSSGTSSPSKTTASYTYVLASTYGIGDGLMYSATASGGRVTPTSMGVAMKTMPLGTVIEIIYNGRTARAVVNDRGPYVGNRQIDLQPAVANALGFDGVGRVGYRVVG